MSPTIAFGILCGLGVGVGLWTLLHLVPALARPSLSARVAPYVLDVSENARQLVSRTPSDPLPVLGAVFSPPFVAIAQLLDSVLGVSSSTERRLRQAGLTYSVTEFRSRQVVAAAIGGIAGTMVALAAARFQTVPAVLGVAIVILFAVSGFVVRDHVLQRAAKARLARIESELPTVLEFLTLSLSAGEGILDAVRRVSRISRGELAGELAVVVNQSNAGVPFAEAIKGAADMLELAPFSRFVEQLVGALERGTPLAEVLRAQAQDSRDQAKRALLESAGRKEVAMLVPLVFLILPTTIVFAIFPGIFVLQMGL